MIAQKEAQKTRRRGGASVFQGLHLPIPVLLGV